jgi:phosphoglycerate dehydrogenase-like enzyme
MSAMGFGLEIDFLRNTPQSRNEYTWDTVEFSKYDHILNLLPGTDNMVFIDSQVISKFKRGVYYYNLGRGNTQDESALCEALKKGQITGAGLDVTTVEPLEQDSELWELGNVILTPHSSCVYKDYSRLFVDEIIKELKPIIIA